MNPAALLLLAFILVPLAEIALFITLGGYLGALPTIGLVLLTAILGVALLKLQGLLTLTRVRQKLDRGELPALDLAEGLILLIAAVLLLTPGFLTDVVGFLCLVPGLRRRTALQLLKILRRHRQEAAGNGHGEGTIIEGEVIDEPESHPDGQERLKHRGRDHYN